MLSKTVFENFLSFCSEYQHFWGEQGLPCKPYPVQSLSIFIRSVRLFKKFPECVNVPKLIQSKSTPFWIYSFTYILFWRYKDLKLKKNMYLKIDSCIGGWSPANTKTILTFFSQFFFFIYFWRKLISYNHLIRMQNNCHRNRIKKCK